MAFTVLLLMWYEYLCAVCVCVYNMFVCVWGGGGRGGFYFIFRQCEYLYVYTTIVCVFGGGAVYVECFLSYSFSISETDG